MSDRGFCFLFSCAVILASLCAAGWLAATGQATTVDGLFLLLTCLVVALAFALYVMFMIRRAMEAPSEVIPKDKVLEISTTSEDLLARIKKTK